MSKASASLDPRTPVVVGVGQVEQRVTDPATAREPVALLADAARAATTDSGASGLAAAVDTVAVIKILTHRYSDPAALVAADLGIVVGDGLARYQDVGTRPEHRRRGLAAHLLGVAAQWAATQGVTRFVIVTGVDNPAGRVYRGVGFEPDRPTWTVYRRPPLAG